MCDRIYSVHIWKRSHRVRSYYCHTNALLAPWQQSHFRRLFESLTLLLCCRIKSYQVAEIPYNKTSYRMCFIEKLLWYFCNGNIGADLTAVSPPYMMLTVNTWCNVSSNINLELGNCQSCDDHCARLCLYCDCWQLTYFICRKYKQK